MHPAMTSVTKSDQSGDGVDIALASDWQCRTAVLAESVLRKLLNKRDYPTTEETHTNRGGTEKDSVPGRLVYPHRGLPRESPPRKSDCHDERLSQGEG